MPARRIFIVDPGLADAVGHHLSTSVTLAEMVRRTGSEAVLLGHRTLDPVVAGQGVEPFFHDSIYGPVPPSVPVAAAADAAVTRVPRPARDLMDLVAARAIGSEDLIYYHTLTPDHARSVLVAALALSRHCMPHIAAMFRYDPEAEPWVGDPSLLARLLQRIAKHGAGDRIKLFAETAPLATFYAQHLEWPVTPLHHFPNVQRSERRQGGRPTLAYLGEARREKGFDVFADACAALEARGCLSNFHPLVQIYGEEVSAGALVAAGSDLRRRVARAGGETFGTLDPVRFQDIFARTDICVLPHCLPAYSRRGSGIFVDAMVAGTVLVVRKGTWMSSFASSPNVLTFERDSDLVDVIEAAAGVFRKGPDDTVGAGVCGLFSAEAHVDKILSTQATGNEQTQMTTDHQTALIVASDLHTPETQDRVRRQILMLDHAGFDTSLVTVGAASGASENPPLGLFDAPCTFHWQCVAPVELGGYMETVGDFLAGASESWTAKTLQTLAVEPPGALLEACKDAPPHLILCNHLSNLAFAHRLRGPESRIVVEIHRLENLERALTKRAPLSEADYRAELGSAHMADGLVFPNVRLAEHFRKAGVSVPSAVIGDCAAYPGRNLWPEALREHDAARRVAATREMLGRLAGRGSNMRAAVQLAAVARSHGPEGKLLVCYGDRQPSDLSALREFLDQVFEPHLRPQGFLLAVVGGVGALLDRQRPDLEGVICTGEIADLGAVFELPAVSVFTGRASETAPRALSLALWSGQPVIGTPSALAGAEEGRAQALTADLPTMAETILRVAAGNAADAQTIRADQDVARADAWAELLTSVLDRRVEIAGTAFHAVAPVDVPVSERLATGPVEFQPMPAGKIIVTPDTRPVFAGGSFGLQTETTDTHCLWTSSWYFGFILDDAARGCVFCLLLTNTKFAGEQKTAVLDILVDGQPQQSQVVEEGTEQVRIPLPAGNGTGGPVLVECFLPDAFWQNRRIVPDAAEERALGLCIVSTDIVGRTGPFALQRAAFADLDNPGFVKFAYETVLGKAPDEEGMAHYLFQLSRDVTRENILQTLAADPGSVHPNGIEIV